MFIKMKEHVTKCNSVAHRCAFNSIWTADGLSGMEYHWVHSQYLLGSINWCFWYVHGICCCGKFAEYKPSCQDKMLEVNIPANQWYIHMQRLRTICSYDYFFIWSILRHSYSLWGRHLDTYKHAFKIHTQKRRSINNMKQHEIMRQLLHNCQTLAIHVCYAYWSNRKRSSVACLV